MIVERLRELELRRLLALPYVSWLPFASIASILSGYSPLASVIAWSLGVVPFAWSARHLAKALEAKGNPKLAVAVGAFLGTILAFVKTPTLCGALAASALMLGLPAVLKERPYVEALGAAISLAGAYYGWQAFLQAFQLSLSLVAFAKLVAAVHEVVPYLERD